MPTTLGQLPVTSKKNLAQKPFLVMFGITFGHIRTWFMLLRTCLQICSMVIFFCLGRCYRYGRSCSRGQTEKGRDYD